jgi:hypothetical protein
VSPCDRVRADAPGLAALPAGDPERDEAWAHARECPACARALDEAERLQALVGDVAPPSLGAGARAPGGIVSELRREGRRRALASAVTVCSAFVLCVVLARHRAATRQGWMLALAVAAAAAALGAAARRWAIAVLVAAPIAAVGLALASGTAGPLEVAMGVDCLATEVACAAAVVAAAWLALRRGTSSLSPRSVTAGAAAGALGAVAALDITCPAHAALPHLLAFHVAGVLVAMAGAAMGPRLLQRILRA